MPGPGALGITPRTVDKNGVKHTVRSTLLCLGGGIVVQRILQLLAFLVVGRTLGVAGLGVFAQGMAVAAVLAVIAGIGVRNLVARAVSKQPQAARALVGHAVYLRLLLGILLAILATGTAFVTSQQPWFWLLCALHVLPAAFDLKNLIDAAGRTRGEVVLESTAAVLQFAGICTWALLDGQSLTVLAGISLACRSIYAAGAIAQIRRLPFEQQPDRKPLGLTKVGLSQTAHELLSIGDIAVLALLCGDAAAGYYAVAARFAAAALLPSTQLARLLLPHLLHADQRGDSSRTLAMAVRSTLWLTAPICAGGLVVADSLCALSGPEFAASGHVLRLLLFAGVCQHVGWQCSHTLLATHRDCACATGLGWPSVLHALLLVTLVAVPVAEPAFLATLAATAAATAQATYLMAGLVAMHCARPFVAALPAPLAAACATMLAANVPVDRLPPNLQLPTQLVLGALSFAAMLWLLELRGRLSKVGDGLATASGFNH